MKAEADTASLHDMSVPDRIRWIAQSAYGVPADRVVEREGFQDSLQAASDLCNKAGISLDDLVVVAVKSPATMTDDDRADQDKRTVTLKKVEAHTGAGLLQVNLTTSLTTPMPKIV